MKNYKRNVISFFMVVILIPTGAFAQISTTLTINPGKVTGHIPIGIYGHFLEHINNSVNWGLWGELVKNRSFEELNPIQQNMPVTVSVATVTKLIPKWEVVGSAIVSHDTINPLNSQKSIKLVAAVAEAGIIQKGFCIRKNDVLHGSLWVRGSAPGGMVIKLVSAGKVLAARVITAPVSSWKEFKLMLNPSSSADSAELQLLSRGKTEVWIDQVSLMPASSISTGGFRPDLLKAIAALKPASIRYPGGGFASGYHWKNGIGPQYNRIGKGRSTDIDPLAMGIDEFMVLCRKVGAEPVICVPLGKRDNSELEQYIHEAEDELEYCNSPATNQWGMVRAANGHPKPYHVKYWEVDNEVYLTTMSAANYQMAVNKFAAALHKKDPAVKIIGSGGGGTNLVGDKGWSVKMLDGDLSQWDYFSLHQYENYSRAPGSVDSSKFRTGINDFEKYYAALRDSIAKSNRKDIKVYESEWNYMSIDWRTGLYAGGVLNCFERNSDVVTMACPALFLRNTATKGWDNALINFDNRTWFSAPNYVIMKLYRDHFEPYRIALMGDAGPLNVVATKSANGNKIIIKIVNANGQAAAIILNIAGNINYNKAVMQWVAEGLDAKNTIDKPFAVSVHTKKLMISKNSVPVNLSGYAVAVVEISKN